MIGMDNGLASVCYVIICTLMYKILAVILSELSINLWINLGDTEIFIVLNNPIHKYGISVHVFRLLFMSFTIKPKIL